MCIVAFWLQALCAIVFHRHRLRSRKMASTPSMTSSSPWDLLSAAPAANASAGPAAPTLGPVRTEWKYDNQWNGQVGILFTLRGQVSYQHRGTVTDYHGSFREDADGGWVVIHFDCRGDESDLKSLVLLKQPDGSYSGPDYKLRHVVLTKMSASRAVWSREVGNHWRLEWRNMTVS